MVGPSSTTLLEQIVEELELPQSVQNNAQELLKQAYPDHPNTDKSNDRIVAAAIYAAARVEQVGVFPGQIADIVSIDENDLFQEMKQLENNVKIEIPFETAEMFIPQIISDLNLPNEEQTIESAEEIIERIREDGYTNGKTASGVAASVVYVVGCYADWIADHPTQAEIAAVSDVCTVTIREHYQNIETYYAVGDIINASSEEWVETKQGRPADQVEGLNTNATVWYGYSRTDGSASITVYKNPDNTLKALISTKDNQLLKELTNIEPAAAEDVIIGFIDEFQQSVIDDLIDFVVVNNLGD